jgi:integrase
LYEARFPAVSGLELQKRQGESHAEAVFDLIGRRLRDELGCEPYLLDATRRWLCTVTATPPSLISYMQHFRRWVQWSGFRSLSSQIDRTTHQMVENYVIDLNDQGLGKRTIRTAFGVLRSWISWFFDRDLAPGKEYPIRAKNITRLIKVDQARVQKGDGSRQSLTIEEARAVVEYIKHASPAPACVLALLLATGCRGAELANAPRNAFRRSASGRWSWVIKGKGDKTRKVNVEPWANPTIDRWLAVRPGTPKRGPFLAKSVKQPFSVRTLQRWAKEAALAVGRDDISTHDLRKTFATLLMEAGARPDEVQRCLGHSNVQLTLDCYTTRHREMVQATGIGDNQ